jgi:hypothetical protein
LAPGTIALLAKPDTLQAILTLLPNAPLADSQLVTAAFSHFPDRARKAEAAGRHDEAKRFAAFGDPRGGTTEPSAVPTRATAQQKQRFELPQEMKAAPSPAKPGPAAEPTAKPAPVKADARTAVLARLRRQAPAQAAKHHRVASDDPSPVEAPVVPPRQRLLDARAALAAGRIGEAEELLRQAQVLVPRQTIPLQDASATGSVAAGQIAEALSMLSAGDAQHAMQYINLAAVQAGQGQTVAAEAPRFRQF